MRAVLVPALVLSTLACQSTPTPRVSAGDAQARQPLLAAVKQLEGSWRVSGGEGPLSTTTFEVTSGGSAVRETMSPGGDYEMTNMYALDGNALVMTHYCASGNQPTMRATALRDNELAFQFESVRDLKAADEPYMGEMKLVFRDDGSVEQHWKALKAGAVDHAVTFTLTRVP